MKYLVGGNSRRDGRTFSTLYRVKEGVSTEDNTPYIYIDTNTKHYEDGILPFGSIVKYGRVTDDASWGDSSSAAGGKAPTPKA